MHDRSVPLPLRSMAPGHDRFLVNERTSSHPDQAVKCPRCDSLNTKFCYYNNYNVSQPRYFCRNCRRYWTKGGVLRNVPIGGGCRKTTRPKGKKLGVDRLQKESTGNASLSSNEMTVVTDSDPSSSAADLSIQSNLAATALFRPPPPRTSSPQMNHMATLREPTLPNLNLMEPAGTSDINVQGRNPTGKFLLSSAVQESTVPFPVLALKISPPEVDTGDKDSALTP